MTHTAVKASCDILQLILGISNIKYQILSYRLSFYNVNQNIMATWLIVSESGTQIEVKGEELQLQRTHGMTTNNKPEIILNGEEFAALVPSNWCITVKG